MELEWKKWKQTLSVQLFFLLALQPMVGLYFAALWQGLLAYEVS